MDRRASFFFFSPFILCLETEFYRPTSQLVQHPLFTPVGLGISTRPSTSDLTLAAQRVEARKMLPNVPSRLFLLSQSTACCSCLESKKKESLFIYLSSSILEDSIPAQWAWALEKRFFFFFPRYFASQPPPRTGFLAECVICDQLWVFKTFIGGERQIDAFSAACTHQV